MPQPMGFHLRLGWSGWLTLLIVFGLVIAIAAAVAIVVLGVFIVLLPIVLISALLFYLFPSLRRRRGGKMGETDIIEGEYRIVDPRQLEQDVPPGDHT